MIANDPVPGAPVAGPSVALGYTDTPTTAEKLAADPQHPGNVTRVYYRPDGRVLPKAEEVAAEDLGPLHMPAASPEDAPFSTHDIPSGWNRHPTPEEVAYLNEKYPTEGYVPPPVDYTGTFRAFTADVQATALADLEDSDALHPGYQVTLMALSGTAEGMAAIDGVAALVVAVESPVVTLDLDLSGVDVTGLTADYIWEAPPA